MTIETLLNIVSKFPTKESRYRLRFILRDSSKDLIWRNEISDIFYILHKLDSDDLYVYKSEEELPQQPLQEELPEPIQEEPIQEEPIQKEPIQEPIQELIQPEKLPEPKELTDIEKIQLQYEEKVRNILQNK